MALANHFSHETNGKRSGERDEGRTVVKRQFVVIMIAGFALLWCSISFAADSIEDQQIHFSPGKSSATVHGSIRGDKSVDYKLTAKSGQTMSVKLKTSNLSNYFNVLQPGSETALFIGSTSGNDWTGTLTADGEHTARVYLMRSVARQEQKADCILTIGIVDDPIADHDMTLGPNTTLNSASGSKIHHNWKC